MPPKKLVGRRMTISLAQNKTAELWQGFMPRLHEIQNRVGDEKYSLQRYSPNHFTQFDFAREFEKWAAVEVSSFDNVPQGMETLDLAGGLYAVFLYKGTPEAAGTFFNNLFTRWFPASEYDLDDRPHFELLGEKYRNNHPDSEEEIWIPIKTKVN